MKINLADKITTQDTIAVGIWKSISGDCNYNQELPKEILDIVKYTLNHELESYKETYQKIFCLKNVVILASSTSFASPALCTSSRIAEIA